MAAGFAAIAGGAATVPAADRAGQQEMTAPVSDAAPDPVRGRQVALDPERGNCTICHVLPDTDPATDGDVGPSLAGTGARHTTGWLRQRLVDGTVQNPDTVMPAYFRTTGLTNVAARFRGKPVLTAAEIEDVVAYLATLRR